MRDAMDWVREVTTAMRVVLEIRRYERMKLYPPCRLTCWRPHLAGAYSATLGVSARYGLHPAEPCTDGLDHRLMPTVCAIHRAARNLTARFGLPGQPIVCLSVDGARYPAVCFSCNGLDWAAIMFQEQNLPNELRSRHIVELGIRSSRPVFANNLGIPGVHGGVADNTARDATWSLVVRRGRHADE